MIPRRHFVRKIAAFCGTAALPLRVWAEPKKKSSPTPKPAESPTKKENPSQVRLWKTTDAPQTPITVRFLPIDKTPAQMPFKIGIEKYEFLNYVDVPAGFVKIEVVAADQTQTVSRYFAEDAKTTLLVRFQNAALSIECIDDTPAPASSGCVFQIYNLMPASGGFTVTLGTFLNVQLPTPRSYLLLSEIKPAVYPVVIKGAAEDGGEFSENLDLDFSRYRKATLLICTDPYGRVRPRLNTV